MAVSRTLLICLGTFAMVLAAPIATQNDGELQATVEQLKQAEDYLTDLITIKKKQSQKQIHALDARVSALESKTPWTLKRIQYPLKNMERVTLTSNTVEKRTIPNDVIPKNTRAVIVSIKCDKWMETFNSKMSLKIRQDGTKDGGTVVFTAPLNDFYYETLVPWDGTKSNTIMFKIVGASKNKYTLSIAGYIIQ